MRLLLVSLAVFACVAAPAGAATVDGRSEIVWEGDYGRQSDVIDFSAAQGEANALTLTLSADAKSVTVLDPGAVLEAAGKCARVDDHTASCPTPTGLVRPAVSLGDGADSLLLAGGTPYAVSASGGDGDDVLTTTGSPDTLDGGGGNDRVDAGAGDDTLVGGVGVDTLDGGAGDDVLTAGDGAGADALDGGPGRDTASYAARTAAVSVDLMAGTGGGDTLAGVENVVGGSGPDRLTGDRFANRPEGGGGDDRLDGGSGPDALGGGAGDDVALCGPGDDLVEDPDLARAVGGACERVRLGTQRESTPVRYDLPAHPLPAGRRALRLRFTCPIYLLHADPVSDILIPSLRPCSGTLRLREATGARRLLGTAHVQGDEGKPFRVRIALTALGRRRVPRGVDAVVALSGKELPAARWRVVVGG